MASFLPNLQMMNRFKRFQPNTQASEAYQQHEMPNEEDYQPSVWRRIAAGVAGGLTGLSNPEAGMKLSTGIVEAPYSKALKRYNVAEQKLGNAAKLEQDQNEMRSKFESDAIRLEETAREHDQVNKQRDDTLAQRREEAEQRAAAKDVELEQRNQDLERRKNSDQLLSNYRNRMAGVAERNSGVNAQRAGDYGKFVEKYGNKQATDQVTPLDQKRIRQMAVVETMQDPRFAKVHVIEDGSFDLSKLPPNLQQEFQMALQTAEANIVRKKKSSYDYPGSEVTPDDLEFERRMQQNQEDDSDFWR